MPAAPRRRIEPIDDPALDAYRLPDGRPMELFGIVAHSPAALADLRSATARALHATELPPRLRELLILRVLHLYGAVAEWQVHVELFADAVGLSPSDLAAVRGETAAPAGVEGALRELADALSARGIVSDELWGRLHDELGPRGAVEAAFVGAQYVKVALMTNVFQVEPPFPPA
ncbi:carboxymuconolactone decarboxylase family protein [Microbacterium sp. X-17]|uniref:carboxymuconolactone decarboxylase family protein n=1 Tax=Microbacterium sp. X-17 TaxID=3144404 RepID=UPI0031F4C67F